LIHWCRGATELQGCLGAGVQGCRVKAKKLQAKQKKINPPYQKNNDFVWA